MIIDPRLKDVRITPHGYTARYRDLYFIVTENVEADGKSWRHASVSRRDKQLPAYDDLMALKNICMGEHRTALQVFPPKDQHENWAGKRGTEVLHLWSCMEGDVTPDFRHRWAEALGLSQI